ncbi:hypothetical protein JXA84_07240 [candidate division WOR-3 bacterium]|nr:hypothetical protein [candidate division WOR-3 bacterium]
MVPEEIETTIRRKMIMRDNKECIECSKAFEAASELGVDVKEIGRYCNRLKIKIVSCQLGCFT